MAIFTRAQQAELEQARNTVNRLQMLEDAAIAEVKKVFGEIEMFPSADYTWLDVIDRAEEIRRALQTFDRSLGEARAA